MFLTFVAIRLVPGDPIEVRVGERGISPERLALLRHQLGLDQPLWQQFLDYAGQLAHGDFGVSLATQQKVLTEFLTLFPATLELSFCAMLFAILVGVPRGVIAAVQARRLVRLGADDGLAVRLFHADLLVGPDAHHVLLGDARLDAGLRAHRSHQLQLRHADRLHADRRGAVGSAGRGARTRCAISSCPRSCSAPCRSASSRA